MSRQPRLALLTTSLLAIALAYWMWPSRTTHDAMDGGADPALLADRVWIEALPSQPTEQVHAMLVLADAPLGVFQRGSAYQSTLELFEYKRDANRIALRFPQSDKKDGFSFRVRHITDHPPFDLALDVSANPWGGPHTYYGFEDEDGAAARVIAPLHHRLAHGAGL
jgi:hypothetical protein